MTVAAKVGRHALNSSGVGCLVSSLKVAPKLHETRVSITSMASD